MAKIEKSIDGLVLSRPSRGRRVVGFDEKKPVRRQAKRVATKRLQQEPDDIFSEEVRALDLDEADLDELKDTKKKTKSKTEDFLDAVESFDFDLTSDELKAERRQRKKTPKQRKKWSKKKKAALIICVVFLTLVGALLLWGDWFISRINGEHVWSLFDKEQTLKTDKNGRTNILVFGTSGYEMGGSGHDGAKLTDSIMVMSLDQKKKDLAMVSIPRDLRVTAACSAGKINEVYWCNNKSANNEAAGAVALEKAVTKVLGLDLQYYTHVDWGALVQVVDSLGGITVTLDENIADSMTKTYIKAGVATTLNGEQALGLARARHGTTGGDFSRGNSQQKIIVAISEKMKEKGVGVAQVLNMVSALGDNVRTDFKTAELKTLVKLRDEIDLNKIRQIPLLDSEKGINLLTTTTLGGVSYVVPVEGVSSYGDIHKYIAKALNNNKVTREEAKIMVLNGSGEVGVAARTARKLEQAGYTVANTGDAPNGEYQKYEIYALNQSMPATKKALAKRYKTKVRKAAELPAGINSTGYDFIIIIGKSS